MQLARYLPAADVGQAYVDVDDIRLEVVRDHEGGAAAVCDSNIVAFILKQYRESQYRVPIVIDNEDA